MLYYSPQIWCSDDTDAIERLGIQEGTALIYPLSAMGAHVSDCPNHTVGRNTPFKTRGEVCPGQEPLVMSWISHAIRLYAKALAENLYTTGERRVEACQGIEKNVKEIEEYVNEITLASREDFLQLSVNPGEVYLSHVIDAIRGLYEEKLHNLHTGFQIASYTDLLLKGDADRLIEVLQNLLENAIKYGDGKCISIDFSEEEDCRLITVRNSGCSLKQEELINLFDSFYRGSNVGSADGSGLGLYISRQLMQKMDGEVFAEIKEDDFCATVVVRKA